MVGPAKAYRSVGAGSRVSYSGDTHSARSRHSLSYVSSACSAADPSYTAFPSNSYFVPYKEKRGCFWCRPICRLACNLGGRVACLSFEGEGGQGGFSRESP
ncbi:hypothetical protein TSUD_199230 [Trifolium subterraneum]|uniref:Uncharacterized protein n=1 Tax=Trifolium subterraneum TaxID=3900 RepID=A0A2Z6LMH6_TRISU|nr:hypothetical protein TSUD_199230 [Trifolium subterraneum]